jgi:hypothetical protein
MLNRRISAYQPGSTSSTQSEPPSAKVPTLSPPPTLTPSPSPSTPLPALTPQSSPSPTPPPSPLPSFPSAPPLNLTASSPTLPTLTKIDPPKEVMAPSLTPTPTLIERIRENPITSNLPEEVEQAQVPWKKAVTLGVGLFFMGILVGIVSMVFLYQ